MAVVFTVGWDTATGGLEQTLEGHSRSVHSVAFSRDGRLLASGSRNNIVRIYDTATDGLHETLNTKGLINKLQFSQERSYLIINLGTLDVQSGFKNLASNSTQQNPVIFIQQGQWINFVSGRCFGEEEKKVQVGDIYGRHLVPSVLINLNGKDLLWLPPDFRRSCSAINMDSLVSGHASRRISFLRLRL
ncbi:hypothetical protein N7540_004083 [Penicillium herquei]|nr:hypothetical protein N7540_004083 [Penicillium herquei]